MSKRNWIIAALLGVILTSSLQAQHETKNTQQPATKQANPTSNDAFGIPVRIIESREAAEARKAHEEETSEREIKDLIAQQSMAAATDAINQATQSMKRAAWWSVLIIGIGTALLIWTLMLTKQANKAAQEAVAVTREIGLLQTRAYLDICDAKVTNLKIGESPTIQIAIKNCGQSPARNFKIRSTVGFINNDPDTIKLRHGVINPSNTIIGPSVISYLTVKLDRTLSQDDMRGFHAGEYHFVVGVSLGYDTVFGQLRRAVFRLVSYNNVFVRDKEMVPLKASHRNNRSN